MPTLKFRPATVADAPSIQTLINSFAQDDLMLARSLVEVYETIRDFSVCTDADRVIGCCAIHISWEDLGEIRSLAVNEGYRGLGIGDQLVDACIKNGIQAGLKRVFVLTYIRDFFTRLGFEPINKAELPHKVWADCTRCPKFPDCNEEALSRSIDNYQGGF